jgi:hypothetical protein
MRRRARLRPTRRADGACPGKKPAPHLMRGGHRFSEKDMRKRQNKRPLGRRNNARRPGALVNYKPERNTAPSSDTRRGLRLMALPRAYQWRLLTLPCTNFVACHPRRQRSHAGDHKAYKHRQRELAAAAPSHRHERVGTGDADRYSGCRNHKRNHKRQRGNNDRQSRKRVTLTRTLNQFSGHGFNPANHFCHEYGGGCGRGFVETWAAVLAKRGGCVADG